jgi:hypothetical protein
MILPPLHHRREIDRYLSSFFSDYKLSTFQRAVSLMCQFYGLRRPRIEWYEYLDWGKTAGKTYENGIIHLVHPENWKKGRKYKSERQWINVVYHEMGHYIYWVDAERKADAFAHHMVRGLRLRQWKTPCLLSLPLSDSSRRVHDRTRMLVAERRRRLWQPETKKRQRVRIAGGSIGIKRVSRADQTSAKRLPGRYSFAVSKGIAKSKRSRT